AGAPEGAVEAAGALAQATQAFEQSAADLERLAEQAYTLGQYGAAWEAAGVACQPATAALALALTYARRDHLAGAFDVEIYGALEQTLAHVLGIVAHGNVV